MKLKVGNKYRLRNNMIVKITPDECLWYNMTRVAYIGEYDGYNHKQYSSLDIIKKIDGEELEL